MEFVQRKSLISKFMIIFIIIALTFLITFLSLILYAQNISLEQAKYTLQKNHIQIIDNIDNYFDDLENLAFTVAYSTITQEYFYEDNLINQILMSKNLQTLYMNTVTMQGEIVGFSLFDYTYKNLFRNGRNTPSFDQLGEPSNAIAYSNKLILSNGMECFSLFYPIYRIESSKLLGDIIGYSGFTIDTSRLKLFLRNRDMYAGSMLILTDGNEEVLSGSSSEAVSFFDGNSILNMEDYIVLETSIDRTGWKLYSYMPRGMVSQEFQPIVTFTIVAAVIIISLMAVMFVLIYRQVFRPVRKLSKFMSMVPDDTVPVRFQIENEDEIGGMANAMNKMLDALSEKNEALRLSETKRLTSELTKQQMELLAYRNQINPHFLYNTLECIRGIAYYHEALEVVEISQSLSRMFRYAVKGGDFVKIGDEIQYIMEYSKIIGYRFNHRIKIQPEFAPELSELFLIKLCLQPFVENAVIHGLETVQSEGVIRIYGTKDEGGLCITIEDNGIGMEPNKLEGIRRKLDEAYQDDVSIDEPQNHIGISNIARRLYLFYGKESSISIESTVGQGTLVHLGLPIYLGDTDV